MRDWIDDWVKTLAEQAFSTGDAQVVSACCEWWAGREPVEPKPWQMNAEVLYQTQGWFRALQWAERWYKATASIDAVVVAAQIEAGLQLYRQAERRLGAIPESLRTATANELLNSLQSALPAPQRDNQALWVASTIDAFLAAKTINDEAISVCGEALLALDIRETEVLRDTGLAHWACKRKVDALRLLSQCQLNDDNALSVLTEAQVDSGQYDQARQTLLRWQTRDRSGLALTLNARCDLAQENQKSGAQKKGEQKNGEQQLLQGIEKFPDCEALWKVVGAWLMHATNPIALRDGLRQLTQTQLHDNADALAALALAESRCGATLDIILSLYQKAVACRPGFALAHKNIGACLFRLGQFGEARLAFGRAIQAKPDYVLAWGELGMTCLKLQEFAEAERCLLNALVLKPDDVGNWNNLGSMMLSTYRYHAAVTALERGLALDANHRLLLSNVSIAYVNNGRFSDARQILQRLLREPLDGDVTSITNLLFTINYDPDLSSEEIITIYKDAIKNGFPAQRFTSWPNKIDSKRRLRIAYVSADYCNHPCYHFVQPLLKHHRHDEFCIVAFSNVTLPDEKTAELKTYFDEWHDLSRMTPNQMADFIHQQNIDILVDLSGHTSGNILPVFALKPAPLQMTWLGFGYSSGLSTMDYFLCDEEMYPIGSEALFTEQAARIALPCFVYKPSIYAPDVNASPAQSSGVVTFGSLSRPIRLNHRCLSVWANILQRVPSSRLILNCHAFGEQQSITEITRFFVENGIAAERLDIASTSPPWPVYQKMDIALDCFPHNSGTTLFEGLLMGVPFITRRDRVSMGRLGATIARGINHPEWIADSDEEYADKAVSLAQDIAALAGLRAELRPQLLNSKLCDAQDFTQRVEQQYREMWQHWCQSNAGSTQ